MQRRFSPSERRSARSNQGRPERVESAEVDLPRGFEIDTRQLRVVHFRGELLGGPRILRHRKRATDVGADDPRVAPQFNQRPYDIVERETPAFPVRNRVGLPQAIEVDRDVNIRRRQLAGEAGKFVAPVRQQDRASSQLMCLRSAVSPGMNFQPALAFRAAVPKKLARPPAFEIAATPNARLDQSGQLQGAIDPAAAAPAWRPHIPIRVVIERNKDERLAKPAKPERSQVMEVAGSINKERRQARTELAKEFLNERGGRRETEARSPPAGVYDREVPGQIRPGIVEIEVQSSKSLCAQFTGRKRT